MNLQTQRSARNKRTQPFHTVLHTVGDTPQQDETPAFSEPPTGKRVPKKPSQPMGSEPTRATHLVRDETTGTVHVRFLAAERNSDHEAIEECLGKRIKDSADAGDTNASARVCQAADELVDLLQTMALSSEDSLSLAQDGSLWQSLLRSRKPTAFVGKPANTGERTDLAWAQPVNHRVVAALLKAMIRRHMFEDAARLFDACPRDVDRRRVLKRLLTPSGKRADPAGGVLALIDKPEAIAVFERALKDMLSRTDSSGQLRYAAYQSAADSLFARWHPAPNPQPLRDLRQQLLSCGCVIVIDPSTDRERLVRVTHQALDSHALDLLLRYVELALQHTTTAGSVPELVDDVLASFGLHVESATASRAGALRLPALPSPWPDEQQRMAATDFVRQCCTLLLGSPHHAPLADALLSLSLALEDPGLATDPAFAAAALQARQHGGSVWAWTLSQLPSPRQFPEQLIRSLTEHLGGIQSAPSALVFIHDITTGLATLQALAARHKDAERESAWQQACQQLLPAMVKHFATLVHHKPEADQQVWEPLAQWLWVADAALNLTPSEAASHADCLSVLHKHHAPLAATLSLLCPADVLRVETPPSSVTAKHIQALFAACPLGTRQAVLRLPVLALWMRAPITLPIRQFLADNALPPEQQAPQLVALIDAGVAMAGLPELLASLLDTASLAQLLAKRQPNKQDVWWLEHALGGLLTRWRTTPELQRPRALPNLLDLYRRITLNTSRMDRHGLWSNWKTFVGNCALLPQLEAQDWALLGAYLPLGPEARDMEEQIRQLSQAVASRRVLVLLLRAWLSQRFAEAIDSMHQNRSRATEHEQFQAVWAITKGLLRKLTPEERKAIGIEVETALKTMAKQYEALLKKS